MVNSPTSYAYIASSKRELTAEFLSLTAPVGRRNLISIGIEAELSVTNNLAFYGGFWPGGACDFAGYLTTISKFSSLHNGRSGTDLLGSLLH